MRFFRLLLFVLLVLVLSPLWMLGLVAYVVRLKRYNQPAGISGTAYEPFMNRVLAHGMGARNDPAAYDLAPALPAFTPLVFQLTIRPMIAASRVSGYQPVMLCGPVEHPATLSMFMPLRNDFYDRAFAEGCAASDQVVLLGAGWDTRSYAEGSSGAARIFEVDTAATQAAKIAALQRAGIDHGHVTFVETDFNQQAWWDALAASDFDPGKRTLVIWEGVTMYLPEQAVRETLAAVAGFGAGSRIAFDYFSREFIDDEGGYRIIAAYAKWAIKLTYGERFVFGIPLRHAGRDGVAALLESEGLVLTEFESIGTPGGLSAVGAFACGEKSA